MLFLDAVIVAAIFALIFFVAGPLLIKAYKNLMRKDPLPGDLGDVEKEVDSALDTKKQADEVITKAKEKADEFLHRAEEIKKKL